MAPTGTCIRPILEDNPPFSVTSGRKISYFADRRRTTRAPITAATHGQQSTRSTHRALRLTVRPILSLSNRSITITSRRDSPCTRRLHGPFISPHPISTENIQHGCHPSSSTKNRCHESSTPRVIKTSCSPIIATTIHRLRPPFQPRRHHRR